MSWREVVAGMSLSVSLLGVSALGACSMPASVDDGDGGGVGGGSNPPDVSAGSGTTDRALEVVADSGGTMALGTPPYACASDANWRGWQAPPLTWGSVASAEYARAALATGALPDPRSLSLDDFLARFAPPPGDAAAVAGALYQGDVSNPLKAQLDVTVYPARSELAAPAVHLVVVVDTSQGMLQELALASEVLRTLGASLDEQGDALSVVRWSAASELVVERSNSPAAAADQAANALAALASQLPPSADLSSTLDLLVTLSEGGGAHVVLLTDGSSPVAPEAVARLREKGALVSVMQLVGAQRTGDTLPFAGGLLRTVALEGGGAALWMHELVSAHAELQRSFDAVFRRTDSPLLEIVAPYPLVMPSSESQEFTLVSHGVGAPLRVVIEADVCSPDFYDAPEGEAWWGQFAVAGGTPQAIEPNSRAQLQWLATRRIFELLSEGCPEELPLDLVPELEQLGALAANDPDLTALLEMSARYVQICNASAGGPAGG
jgi:hypothetical protein